MSDKQRADHIQAKYWNGFITRTEAQKVFDEIQQVIMAQAAALQRLDAAVSCIAEKLGVTAEDINNWLKTQVEKAQKAAEATKAAPPAPVVPPEAELPPIQPQGDGQVKANGSIVLTDN